jgi:hypothetical protein
MVQSQMPTSNGVIKRLEPKIAQQQVKKENIKRPDNQPWKKKERCDVHFH